MNHFIGDQLKAVFERIIGSSQNIQNVFQFLA